MRLRILALLAAAVPYASSVVHAQVFDLTAGASTLYGAEGASLAIHSGNSETSIGAGLLNGHFGIGAASTVKVRGGLLTSGQQQFSMELPTDIFGGAYLLSGTGVGYHSTFSKTRSLDGSAGVSATETGTPLFQSTSLSSPTLYAQWKQPLTDSLTSVSTGVFSSRMGTSFLQSIAWNPSPKSFFAFSAGLGGGSPYAAVSAIYRGRKLNLQASYALVGERFERGTEPEFAVSEPIRENVSGAYQLTRSISLSGVHRNYLTQIATRGSGLVAKGASSIGSSLDETSIQYRHSSSVVSLTLLHSSSEQHDGVPGSQSQGSSTGFSAAFDQKAGRFEWSETLYDTLQATDNGSALLVSGLACNFNPHLRLTESVNITSSGPSFSHGGGFVTRFSSFEVDYQLLYLATRPERPFEQAMVFDSRVQVFHDLWLQASSSVGPTGALLYTFRLGKQFIRAGLGPASVIPTSFGNSVLRGRVVDEHGAPVEGASVTVDNAQLYTDSKGFFFFREKNAHVHSFRVALDDFMQAGQFSVVSAPASIRTAAESSAQPVVIVVKRLAVPASKAQPEPAGASERRPISSVVREKSQ